MAALLLKNHDTTLREQDTTMDDAQEIARIASSTGFSEDAVRAMTEALRAGGGSMAQFNHFELGGFGQWSAGGMLMIGDMFNNQLKGRVAMLADMISGSLARGDLPMRTARSDGFGFGAQSGWWPEELGQPSSSGAQNGIRYAVFPGTARLAIETGGRVTVYDTGQHQIGGVSQQQGGTTSLRFSSQLGSIEPADLRVVDGGTVEEANNMASERAGSADVRTSTEHASKSQSTAPSSNTGSFQSQTQGPAYPSPSLREAKVEPAKSAWASSSSSGEIPDRGDRAEPEAASMQTAHGEDTARSGSTGEMPGHSPTDKPSTSPAKPAGDPLALLRGLAELRNEGILTEEEFAAKKAELLSRL